jgi:hypothetical protein
MATTSLVPILGSVTLTVLPGAWVGFSVPDRRIPWPVAAALSVAFSPAVLAIQVVALSAIGLRFSDSVNWLCIFNLAALLLVAMRVARSRTNAPGSAATLSVVAPLVCFGLVILVPLTIWLAAPAWRVYGWHNMWQLEACYQIANLPAIPQEWDLAGLRLNHGWLGLVQLTAVSWQLKCSPTLVYPWLNALQLLAVVTLLYFTARQLMAEHALLTSAALAVVMLSSNLVGMVNWLNHGSKLFSGEGRTAAFIGKYVGIDPMTVGLALTGGLVYTIALATTEYMKRIWLLVPVLLLGIGLSYPLLLPSTLLICGLLCIFLRAPASSATVIYPWRTLLLMLIGLVGAVAVALFYQGFLSEGRPIHALELADKKVLWVNTKRGIVCMSLPFAVAGPMIWRGWKCGSRTVQLLSLGALACSALYLFTAMPDRVQYKNLFTAFICLVPLASVQVVAWLSRLGRGSPLGALGAVALAGAVTVAFGREAFRPPELARAVPVDESSFYLHAVDCPDEHWLEAVRTKTTPATLLVSPDSALPVATLAQRGSVAPAAGRYFRVGNHTNADTALLGLKGYPAAVLASRRRLRNDCYSDCADFAAVTAELQSLGRPIAIVFDRLDAAYLAWLKAHGLGAAVHQEPGRLVWLLQSGQS